MATPAQISSLTSLYVGYFDRAPDPEGLQFWITSIGVGVDFNTIVGNFAQSAEATTLYPYLSTPGLVTPASFIGSIYLNLFNRPAEPAGLTFWVDLLSSGAVSAADMIEAILNGAQGTDKTILDNKVEAGRYFAETAATASGYTFDAADAKAALNGVTVDAATVTASKAATDTAVSGGANVGTTFTLTSGSDIGAAFTGTASNDVFSAGVVLDGTGNLVDTLQNVDQLNGGAGTDTLNVTLNTVGTVTPTLNSIEMVSLRATAAADLNLSAATGTTNVNVGNSTAVATVSSIGAAAVGVANQNQNVNINGSTAAALALNLNTVGTQTTDITVDLASATVNAATSFAITAKDAYVIFTESTASAATTSATVAATGTNELTFAAADLASLATLTVTGAGSVDFTGAAMTGLKTLTAADGGVKVNATGGTLETVTTGAGKDTITAVGATVKNISTGDGDDAVSIVTTALAATSVVNLGAGNDTLSLSVAPTAGATLSGGDGIDTLSVLTADYATVAGYSAANLAKITGFETLSITDALAAATNIDLSKVAGLTSFQTIGVTTGNTATVSNVGANASIIMKGDLITDDGTLVVSLKDATGGSDALNLTLNHTFTENNDVTVNTAAVTALVTAAGVETLNVNSTGTASTPFLGAAGNKADGVINTLALTDVDLVTLNATGDQGFSFTSAAGMTKLATIDASALTAGATIDASAAVLASPALTITGSATAANTLTGGADADTIVGGAMADTITGGAKGDTLTGNGGNDKFVFTAGSSSIGTGASDTITDFIANATGVGVGGAVTVLGATGVVAADLTGDLLVFTDFGNGSGGIVVDVLANAANATTFLANNAGTADTVLAALDSSTSNLYVDNTGDGVADFFINLAGVTTIDAAAFELV